MFLVGVTGGISTGKSTVSKYFAELGCTVLDADLVAREVVEPGKPAWKKIVRHFGLDILNEDGTLNREKLGEMIFSDASLRRKLNSFTHPAIMKSMLFSILCNFFKGRDFLLLDIPLLFESGNMLPFMSEVLVVSCDADLQLSRLIQRNSLSEDEAQRRINAQLPLADKCKRATFIVDNSGSLSETEEQVRRIHNRLKSSRKHWIVRFGVLAILAVAVGGCVVCVNAVISRFWT
ncbi:hypothetical protein CAPTEDRAFT_126614 [Capitella teleta]|uniref:Dephospho-CoA kinase domain-containing protein n=1 Tax=Capitella teleta TaxID=283909 RepID=R7U3B3_CAPTE|nr:hypothetical protein CAPTEDRAFT_126614 [Capitella teleta]|eukprot:ELU00611.1 hypothetical protein CAPTEDRAFT_126614 [Capitella teleta]